jgi:hypothetical protein
VENIRSNGNYFVHLNNNAFVSAPFIKGPPCPFFYSSVHGLGSSLFRLISHLLRLQEEKCSQARSLFVGSCLAAVWAQYRLSCCLSAVYAYLAEGLWSSSTVISLPTFTESTTKIGRVIARAVSRRLLTSKAWVRTQGSQCGICGGRSGTGTGFSPNPSVLTCQYNSTAAPYSLMYHLRDGQWAR